METSDMCIGIDTVGIIFATMSHPNLKSHQISDLHLEQGMQYLPLQAYSFHSFHGRDDFGHHKYASHCCYHHLNNESSTLNT